MFDPVPAGPTAGNWRQLSGWPRGATDALLALDADGDTLFVANGNRALITRSVNGGTTWAVVNGDPNGGAGPVGGPGTPDGFFVVPAGHAHAGRLLAGGGILFSNDRGSTWAEAARSFPGDPGYANVFVALPSGRVLVAGEWGVAGSDDGGASYAVTPLYQDGRYILDGLAAVATPGSVQTGAPACGLPDTALCDGAVVVGTDFAGTEVRAWRTNDGGRTWSAPVTLSQPYDGIGFASAVGVVEVGRSPDRLGRAVAVLGRGLVYATSDGGQTWQAVGRMPIYEDVHSARLVRLGPDGHFWVSTLRAGPTRGWIYRSAEPATAAFPVTGEASPSEVPAGVSVSVRPNPAGGRVDVVVSLGSAGPVRVAVVDVLGREVAVVFDGASAAGERVVGMDASGWPAGVYVVQVTAGARAATARLTVVR